MISYAEEQLEYIKQKEKQNYVDTSTLSKVKEILNGDRLDSYGSPSESFKRISEYWDNYLLHKNIDIKNLKPSDAAMMMVLFKIAREENKHKEDNIIDAIAYLVLYNNLIKEETDEP